MDRPPRPTAVDWYRVYGLNGERKRGRGARFDEHTGLRPCSKCQTMLDPDGFETYWHERNHQWYLRSYCTDCQAKQQAEKYELMRQRRQDARNGRLNIDFNQIE